jgi:hypothetical protein
MIFRLLQRFDAFWLAGSIPSSGTQNGHFPQFRASNRPVRLVDD